ncbi:MAG TPA: hypothetical protein VLC46_16445 [Thermoanaerobaculia bacterium]|jgi:hypothetical protein|nr:hypothetical protein [Thermoanaerobaculia bacterium]
MAGNDVLSSFLLQDPLLTGWIGTAPPDETRRIATRLAPPAEVFSRTFNYAKFGKENQRRQKRSLTRPRGGPFNKMEGLQRTKVPGYVEEKGLEATLDRRDRDEAIAGAGPNAANAVFNLRTATTFTTKSQVLNGKEYETSVKLQDPTPYGAQHSADIANFSNTGVRKWLFGLKRNVRQKANVAPNALYLAENIYWEALENADIRKQFPFGDHPIGDAELATYFRVKEIIVGGDHVLDEDDTPLELWQNTAILFYNNPDAGLNGATFAKSFFKKFDNNLPYYVASAFDKNQNEDLVYAEQYSPDGCEITFPDAAWLIHA